MSDKFSISKHPIYIEAMTIYHKNIVKFALISLALVILLFIAIVYEYNQSGKNCIEQCKKERITDKCNDHCF